MLTARRAALLVSLSIAIAGAPLAAREASVVERYRVDAHGRVSGMILSDHTEIAVPPALSDDVLIGVRIGDSVRVSRAARGQLPTTIVDERTGQSFAVATPEQMQGTGMARGGGPSVGTAAPGTRTQQVDDAWPLPTVTVWGPIRFMLRGPDGTPTGFVMDDGAQVHVVPRVAEALRALEPGQTVRVVGRGVHGSQGVGLWAVSIARPDLTSVLDLSRGPLAPEIGLMR